LGYGHDPSFVGVAEAPTARTTDIVSTVATTHVAKIRSDEQREILMTILTLLSDVAEATISLG
jgi:hypothetical protein